MTEWVSQAEAVRLLSDLGDTISQPALSQYLKGHPEVVRRDQGPGRSQLIDWDALKKSRGTRTSRGPASQAPLPQSEPSAPPMLPLERAPERSGETVDLSARRARADTDRAEFEARRARILAEQAEGKLISRDDAVSAFTAAGIALTRAFEEARLVIPSRTFERRLAAGQFDGAVGAVARSLQFPIGSDRGYTRVTADYFAREALEQYAVSVAGTPETPTINSRVPRAVGTIKRGGTQLAAVISGDATITNVLGEDSYAGSKFVDDVALEGRTAAINITGRFKGAAMRDLGKVPVGSFIQDASDFDLEWALAPNLKLVLTIRNVRFARVGIGTSGPGRLDVPLRGRAEIGTNASMVTAVLTNTTASYN